MKRTTTFTLFITVIALFTLYISCDQATTTVNPNLDLASSMPSSLPQDVLQSCTITQSEFNGWFNSGTASENGIINPPNSVTFPSQVNCDFYKWSWQMFAWLVSPISSNETVIAGPEFYTVSPEDSLNQRILTPHTKGQTLRATSSITQAGPNGLPTIRDKQGNLFEVEKFDPSIEPMTLTGVKIHSVDIDAIGKPIFKSQSGKAIINPKVQTIAKGKIVKEFKASNGKSVFVGPDGVVESEEGQAGGSHGLMAQNKSIVYYITLVNDVYAVFLSANKTNQISGYQFPTTAEDLDSIIAIAMFNDIPLVDSSALALEIKTSWIEASTLSNIENYVIIDAIIPTYHKTDTLWTQTGEKKVKLALLGMHVVGSTARHPEMVWATFEHQENSPFTAYQYLNQNNEVDTIQAESQGSWTLSAVPANDSSNISHFTAQGNSLIAESDFSVSPSNTSLVYPWGSEMGVTPNNLVASSAASNSEVISLNNSVYGWMIGNDIRKNYLMIGATWTNHGVGPTGYSYSTDPDSLGASVGTSLLANSTMETYKQNGSTNCFSCHNNAGGLKPADLSHVFEALQPLPNFKTASDK